MFEDLDGGRSWFSFNGKNLDTCVGLKQNSVPKDSFGSEIILFV